MKKYDMHIATESTNDEPLRQELVHLGFMDDNLAERSLTFDPATAAHYTSCPLINIHVSRKFSDHTELRAAEIAVDKLLKRFGTTGYWHSEFIVSDIHVGPTPACVGTYSPTPLPFERLVSRPRSDEKVWDLHLAFRERTMPDGLGKLLIENGVYHLTRLKKCTGGTLDRFAVYTVQGINPLTVGRDLYTRLNKWLQSAHVPPCDMKLELTTNMKIYNNPRLVPPTIDTIVWR